MSITTVDQIESAWAQVQSSYPIPTIAILSTNQDAVMLNRERRMLTGEPFWEYNFILLCLFLAEAGEL